MPSIAHLHFFATSAAFLRDLAVKSFDFFSLLRKIKRLRRQRPRGKPARLSKEELSSPLTAHVASESQVPQMKFAKVIFWIAAHLGRSDSRASLFHVRHDRPAGSSAHHSPRLLLWFRRRGACMAGRLRRSSHGPARFRLMMIPARAGEVRVRRILARPLLQHRLHAADLVFGGSMCCSAYCSCLRSSTLRLTVPVHRTRPNSRALCDVGTATELRRRPHESRPLKSKIVPCTTTSTCLDIACEHPEVGSCLGSRPDYRKLGVWPPGTPKKRTIPQPRRLPPPKQFC